MRWVIDEYGIEVLSTGSFAVLLSDYAAHLPEDKQLIRYVIENTSVCKIYNDAYGKDEQTAAKAQLAVQSVLDSTFIDKQKIPFITDCFSYALKWVNNDSSSVTLKEKKKREDVILPVKPVKITDDSSGAGTETVSNIDVHKNVDTQAGAQLNALVKAEPVAMNSGQVLTLFITAYTIAGVSMLILGYTVYNDPVSVGPIMAFIYNVTAIVVLLGFWPLLVFLPGCRSYITDYYDGSYLIIPVAIFIFLIIIVPIVHYLFQRIMINRQSN